MNLDHNEQALEQYQSNAKFLKRKKKIVTPTKNLHHHNAVEWKMGRYLKWCTTEKQLLPAQVARDVKTLKQRHHFTYSKQN